MGLVPGIGSAQHPRAAGSRQDPGCLAGARGPSAGSCRGPGRQLGGLSQALDPPGTAGGWEPWTRFPGARRGCPPKRPRDGLWLRRRRGLPAAPAGTGARRPA